MAFEWLGDIAQRLVDLLPKIEIVDNAHGAVKFVFGHKIVALGPGWHWYWPITTKMIVYPTARQSSDLRTITTVTNDNVTLLVGGMVVYEITDIEPILAHTWDVENTIHDLAIGAISDVVCGRYSYAQLIERKHSGELDAELRERLSQELKSYGINVIATRLPDLCPVRVYKVVGTTPKYGDT